MSARGEQARHVRQQHGMGRGCGVHQGEVADPVEHVQPVGGGGGGGSGDGEDSGEDSGEDGGEDGGRLARQYRLE